MKTTNQAASIAALFFYFAYAPCYNLDNNALTYSETSHQLSASSQSNPPILTLFSTHSLPHRTLPLRRTHPRHRDTTDLRQSRRLLLQQRQPGGPQRHKLEIPRHLLRMDLL